MTLPDISDLTDAYKTIFDGFIINNEALLKVAEHIAKDFYTLTKEELSPDKHENMGDVSALARANKLVFKQKDFDRLHRKLVGSVKLLIQTEKIEVANGWDKFLDTSIAFGMKILKAYMKV